MYHASAGGARAIKIVMCLHDNTGKSTHHQCVNCHSSKINSKGQIGYFNVPPKFTQYDLTFESSTLGQ